MAQTAERPPTPQGKGGPEGSLRDGTDSLPNKRNPPSAQAQIAVAAAIADLTIDASVEAADIASVTARQFAERVEIGDVFAAEHSLTVVHRLRQAIVQFAEWRTLEVGARR